MTIIVGVRDNLTILEPTHSEQLTMSDRERMPDSAQGGTARMHESRVIEPWTQRSGRNYPTAERVHWTDP